MKRKIYAAYGSNMALAQMGRRCPNAMAIGKGELKGYKLTFRGSGVANVEVSDGSKVPVVLWEITAKCERALDAYEGYPNLYVKKNVEVRIDGEPVPTQAFVYVMVAKYEAMPALPGRYYFDIICEGYADNGIDQAPLYEALERCTNEM